MGSDMSVTPEPTVRRAAVAPPAFDIVRERAPGGFEIVPIEDTLDLETVDFLVPPSGERDLLGELPQQARLSVVQVLSAGTDWIEDQLPPQVTLCNARGARDDPVAEWILGGAPRRLHRAAGFLRRDEMGPVAPVGGPR